MTDQDARSALLVVLRDHPDICRWGFRTRRLQDRFDEARDSMLPAIDEFTTAAAWLSLLERTTHVNRRAPSSYWMKHAAEKWGEVNGMSPYVANGMLIAAALHLGFLVERDGYDSLNADLNVAQRSLKRLHATTNAKRAAMGLLTG